MRYKNKEKFNRGIMKNIKKKQEKEEIKIINYKLPTMQNENNYIKDFNSNIINNNQNVSKKNLKNLNNNYITNNNNFGNNTLRYNSSKKIVSQDSFLKKALENMAKNTLNKSEDSQIFNMEKNDQITDNIIMENKKTSLMSRNYLQRQVSDSNSSNKKFNFQTKAENKNNFGNIKVEILSSKVDKPIELKSDINLNHNINLENDLKGPQLDFYKKRMDYLSHMFLNFKNNPFDYLENDQTSMKRKISKFIPKSASIFKERKENYYVHLIKKFSDFKVPSNESQIRSKTATMRNKISNFIFNDI